MAERMGIEGNYILPSQNLELVEGWGMSSDAVAYVFRPSTLQGIRDVFEIARTSGRSIAFRGAGRSYGDAALNSENVVLDLTRFSRILDWNPDTGIIRVESGVTIRQLWEYILPDGWWPPVVPGTMFPTLGGCASMNIHGKNNFRVGPIGDHITEFEILLPTGELRRCSRQENPDLFYAAIGGFGMLGCFITLTIRMKKVYSGLMEVEPINTPSLDAMIRIFEERMERADYLVGWIDGVASGKNLGRGVIHEANYLKPGDDPNPAQTLRLDYQQLPDTILGLLPKSILWRFMRPFVNNAGVRFVNLAKFLSSRILDRGGKKFRQSHAAFAFLLDYVPNWKRSYGVGGLIQYQSFIPEAHAAGAFKEQLTLAQRAGFPPYLAVFKRHRRDDFLMTHGVDGYSLALDFRITKKNRRAIWALAAKLDQVVLNAGGRFYFAKDSTLSAPSVKQYLGESAVRKFRKLKEACDPDGILETNLYRRLFQSPEAADAEPVEHAR
ncbi:MAG: FAD/FMN-containing dehydrogenase [Chlorobi bacterium]|nr:FAD/FMN-containing dehydrogenase [Chlorobiota bacterium]